MSKWREVRLGEVVKSIYSGGTPKTSVEEYWNGSIKWLTSGETESNYISDTIQKITQLGVRESSTKSVPKNSIVMASAGQGKTRGQVSFLLDCVYINQSIIAIISNDKYLINKYLFFNFRSRYEEIRMLSDASSSRGSITTKFLEKLKIKIPDLETQEKIANVLSSYDNLIENNNRRIELLENMAEEIYKEWFVRMRFPGHDKTKFEKGIPEGWEYFNLEDICKLVRGISYSTKDIENESGTPMLTLKSINPYGGYNNDGIKYFNGELSDRYLLKPTDILMAITDMTQDRRVIGHVAMVPDFSEELVFSADLILLKDIKLNKYFFYSYLRYGDLSNNIGMFSNGANVLHLNQRILNKIKFIIPSEKFMDEYGDIQKTMINKINYINRQNENLMKQRDMLLPRLMNGSVEVK